MTQPEKNTSFDESSPTQHRTFSQEVNDLPRSWIVTSPEEKEAWPSRFRLFFWFGLVALLVGLGYFLWPSRPASVAGGLSVTPTSASVAISLSVTPSPISTSTATTTALSTSEPTFFPTMPIAGAPPAAEPEELPTLPAGGTLLILTPQSNVVGWTSSLDGQSHFNDPNIHVGVFNDHVYYGAFQFDLSQIPPAAHIAYAALELTGLSDQNMSQGGVWQIRMLDKAVDKNWAELQHNQLAAAEADISIMPALAETNLVQGQVNFLPFGPEQRVALQDHLAAGKVSFRIDGPDAGADNLFSWDSGLTGEVDLQEKLQQDKDYRLQFTDKEWARLTRKPILWIVIDYVAYVAITPTSTPENVFTAAAIAAKATAETERFGTATPLPAAWATPIVVTAPPPPANAATATYMAQVVTAEAIAFGTATSTPLNVWTATPTLDWVFVTSTSTPENVVTRAALVMLATQVAQTIGTYTPVPPYWATPFVVTPMPAPRNTATAYFYHQIATAEAFLYGVAWTATPTGIFQTSTPVPTFTPTPGYQTIPQVLVGKIAFLSDRAGSWEETGQKPLVYVVDPGGQKVTLLSNRIAYDTALARDSFSPDQRFRAFVKDFLRFDGKKVPGLYFYDTLYEAEQQITQFGSGIAYDPAWSPARDQITFISNDTKDDEIWVINRDGSNLLQLTASNTDLKSAEIGKDNFIPEVNRHPSWSPDGSQIVFWSNRAGNAQLWLMNADGSNQRPLMSNSFNDWNPVWIKYTDPPPLLPGIAPTRQNPYDMFH